MLETLVTARHGDEHNTREKGKEECVLALLLASVEKIGTGNLVQVPPLPCIGN